MATAEGTGRAGGSIAVRDLLPPRFELERMEGPPFGRDETGRPIAQGTSAPIQGVLHALRDTVEARVRADASPLATSAGLDAQVEEAWQATLDALVRRLNDAIPDPRYRVTPEYLLNPDHRYSYELYAYLAEYARRLSGDPDLGLRAGPHSIPAAIIRLARPLGIQGVFAALPTLSRRISDNDIRSVSTTDTSAVIRWHGTEVSEYVPPSARRAYVTAACEAYRGGLAAVPELVFNAPRAEVVQRTCMADGAEYCEWELTWQARTGRRRREWLLGIVASLVVLALGVSGLPGTGAALLVIASLLPALLVWEATRARRLTQERDREHRLLLEQRESTQLEFDSRERANEELQAANQQLERRLGEITAVHEVGLALSTTLDVDELLASSLHAVVQHLNFERAMVLLADEERGVLAYAQSAGTAPAERSIATGLALPLDDARSPLIEILRSREPLLFENLAEHPDAQRRAIAQALHVTELLGTPLLVKGRAIGVLAVDNGRSRRRIPDAAKPLLFTVGNLVAAAIENARLYRQVEEQNEALEERVAERTREVDRQREYFASLLQVSPVAIAVTDLDMRVRMWNPAAERLFGWTVDEALGHHIDELVATDSEVREHAHAAGERLVEGEARFVTRRTRRDGSLVDVELRGARILDGSGNVTGYYAIYHDITELQQARQDADAANAAKSAFLAAMSHEIRTPMNAVIGMAGLLLETPLSAEQRDYAQTLADSGEALLTIINDILDFSKIEAGRMELELAPFDLRAGVESTLDLVAPLAANKGLELAYEADTTLPAWLVGDVGRVRQILLNLLNNAVKFTESGEVVLAVRGRALEGDDRWEVEIEVRDTGIGIPPDRVGRLFQSFSQADASTSRRYGGTGLGLAISRRLAELMGGTIEVESEGVPGRGSRFTLTFPADVARGLAPVSVERAEASALAGRRLLVVDDNDTNRRIIRLQSRAWGLVVRDTPSPAEALAWVESGDPFDVALIDRQMPEMDGLVLARQLRALPGGRALPIVICSSLGARDATVRAADAEVGLAGYLTKPLKPSSLLDALVSVLAPAEPPEPHVPAASPRAHGGNGASPAPRDTQPEVVERAPSRLRILLAEDNAVNRKLALRLLERLGYDASVAENGREAVDAVAAEPFDAILMDVQMPEMDGLEASREICARWPRDARPRIIAMTANAMQGDREACLEAGMDDYLSKPIRPDELRAALEQVAPRATVGGA